MLKDLVRSIAAKFWNRAYLTRRRGALVGGAEAIGVSHDRCVEAAISIMGEDVPETLSLAQAEAHRGDFDASIGRLHAWISVNPGDATARMLLGSVCRKAGRLDAAARQLEAALTLEPSLIRGWNELGIVNLERGQTGDARQCFTRALALDPRLAEAHCNLGIVALDEEDFVSAVESLRRALALDSSLWEAHCNLGVALYGAGEFHESERILVSALEREPSNALLRLYSSFALLARGEWREGWQRFEARLELPDSPVRFTHRRWNGEPLAGMNLLVSGEQGLGDQIMFMSCLPDAMGCGANCTLSMDRRLDGILRRSFPDARIAHAEAPGREAAFDFQVAAGSLPRWFRNSSEAFPKRDAYLVAEPRRVAYWKRRLDDLGGGIKIGISWRGGTLATRRALRSLNLEDLALPLRGLNPHLVSLQYTDCTEELNAARARHGLTVHHWTGALGDYDETAALVCALDCVVSVCTSIVHLAGALGRAVWVLVPFSPEWRYGRAGGHMPWYPSVRLNRQTVGASWSPVVADVAREIGRMTPFNPTLNN